MTRRGWTVLAAAALVVQLVVLYWPRPSVPGGLAGYDLLVHAVVFGAVAYPSLRAGLPAWAVAAVLVGHALLSEVLQWTVVPGRSGDVTDALADIAGVVVAVAAWWWAEAGTRRGRPSGPG